ncbi:hypothetical protein ACOMHN_024110 [Nucella lapillus]
MSERPLHNATWLSTLLLLLLLLPHANVAISASADTPSTSASASASANQRTTRSVDLASDEEKDGCPSDFVEKFFRILSGPVGKEGEALVAAVLKILSENDRVNWPAMADWLSVPAVQSRDLLQASRSKLQGILLDNGARRGFRGNEKRLAPKFNPTGWRRKRSVDADSLDTISLLQRLLSKYDASELLREDFAAAPKMPEMSDDVKLAPEIPEWREGWKRSVLARRVSRRHPSQRMPKRKPLEFNPTGW